jgi:hypothetical protein
MPTVPKPKPITESKPWEDATIEVHCGQRSLDDAVTQLLTECRVLEVVADAQGIHGRVHREVSARSALGLLQRISDETDKLKSALIALRPMLEPMAQEAES